MKEFIDGDGKFLFIKIFHVSNFKNIFLFVYDENFSDFKYQAMISNTCVN